MPRSKQALLDVISNFEISGKIVDVQLWGSGHIHDTYASTVQTPAGQRRYIHQWINHHVFKEPVKVMQNIEVVTRYARQQILTNGGDPMRETLNLVPAKSSQSYYRSPEGDYWRTYIFIEGARTYDQIDNPNHIYNAAKAFGNFQKMLTGLSGNELHETIPGFHDTPRRYQAFLQAVQSDSHNRAVEVKPEIDFIVQREPAMHVVMDLLRQGKLPQRVTHNDTKLNNVMIDDLTGEGICVIDLDTVMPGTVLYDFGDCVRLGAGTAVEDETDLERVRFDLQKFSLLAGGFLEATRHFLTPIEVEYLPFSALLLTLEVAMRFLTDYLNGDIYFRIHRPKHNLERARNQLKMVKEIEANLERMRTIVAEHAG